MFSALHISNNAGFVWKLRCTDGAPVIYCPHWIDRTPHTRNTSTHDPYRRGQVGINFWRWIQWTCNWIMSVASSLTIIIISTSADPCRSSNHKNLCLVRKKSIKSFWSQLVALKSRQNVLLHILMCGYLLFDLTGQLIERAGRTSAPSSPDPHQLWYESTLISPKRRR